MENIKDFLDAKYLLYNRPEFIETDPVQVPHLFTRKEDIEISGFLTACLAWGNRRMIIRKSLELMQLMNNRPYEFIMVAGETDFYGIDVFCHRTFKGVDAHYFLRALRNMYQNHGGLSHVFLNGFNLNRDAGNAIDHFRNLFFELPCPARTMKHIPNITKGAAAKRLNMFLRWMIRQDNKGVDFGLWKGIDPAFLKIPLDLHTGNTARKLGLLKRSQSDWKAVCELTEKLIRFDPADPVKYDFALFGLGAFENF